ncbi:amidohydrolase family protein, partial [Gammaproteobacteria bacterium]|nr:amidohydrolase family protein [Gammaproteobacteria bacterium]
MNKFGKVSIRVIATVTLAFVTSLAIAQEEKAPKRIMFTNVNVFDGVSETLDMNTNVLVDGNLIAAVSAEPLAA